MVKVYIEDNKMNKLLINILVFILLSSARAFAGLDNILVNLHKCGLDYSVASAKVTSRDSASQKPGYFTLGTGLPTSLFIQGIPYKCYTIEHAFIWFSYSMPGKAPAKKFKVKVTNPKGKEETFTAELCGIGDKQEGTGWNDDAKHHYRVDARSIIDGNGAYTIDIDADTYYMDGLTMMVIHSDMSASYQGHIVINEGLIYRVDKFNNDNIVRHEILGLNVCEATTDTRAFTIFTDLQTEQNVYAVMNYHFNFENVQRRFWNFDSFYGAKLKKGQDKFVFEIASETRRSSDQYTWLLAGLYYRTKNCFTCSSSVDVEIQQTANEVCPGSEVVLTANVSSESADVSDATYEWTSEPAGFTANTKRVTLVPDATRQYRVRVVVGDNCLFGEQTCSVQVLEPPTANAGEDVKLCGTGNIVIGQPASGGNPPYLYEWTPEYALSSTTIATPICYSDKDISYVLKVTDSKGCVGYDTVNVIRYTIDKPAVSVEGDSTLCTCQNTTLSVVEDFAYYQWNTGESTKSITVNKPGIYFVKVTDINGCSNVSDSIEIKGVEATSTIALNEETIYTKLGEDVCIPLRVKSGTNLDRCQLYEYEASISFNRSVLVPISGTPFGQIIEPDRIIDLKGRRSPGDSILTRLNFKAVLGNSDYTQVRIVDFKWKECESNIYTIDSIVKITDICEAGGKRLFDSEAARTDLKQNYPNPFDKSTKIEFTAGEDGIAKLYISNMLGELITVYEITCKAKNNYEVSLDAIDLPSGIYTCKLTINGNEYHKIMRKVGH